MFQNDPGVVIDALKRRREKELDPVGQVSLEKNVITPGDLEGDFDAAEIAMSSATKDEQKKAKEVSPTDKALFAAIASGVAKAGAPRGGNMAFENQNKPVDIVDVARGLQAAFGGSKKKQSEEEGR